MSAGLQTTFEAVRAVLLERVPPLAVGRDAGGRVEVVAPGPLVVAGRRKDQLQVAGAAIRARHVAFDFLPVYVEPELRERIAPDLLALLDGKACFHLRAAGEGLLADVAAAVDAGIELYRGRGWLAA